MFPYHKSMYTSHSSLVCVTCDILHSFLMSQINVHSHNSLVYVHILHSKLYNRSMCTDHRSLVNVQWSQVTILSLFTSPILIYVLQSQFNVRWSQVSKMTTLIMHRYKVNFGCINCIYHSKHSALITSAKTHSHISYFM